MRNLNFSVEILHIICASLATQHAHCHKEYYSPRGQAVSTSHVLGGDSRQRSQFAILSTISSQERRVFSKFHDFHVPRLHHGEPCHSSNFLLSLWIELRFCMHQDMISVAAGKILPAKTIRFFHLKIKRFHRKSIHMSGSTCHSTCPLPQRILLSKRTSHLYESYLNIRDECAAPILREQSDFAILSVISSQETLLFSKFHDFHVPRLHHGKP